MSKFTFGQRQYPTLGLRSQQPKNYVGPTLSCYLGFNFHFYHFKSTETLSCHCKQSSYPTRITNITFCSPYGKNLPHGFSGDVG